MINRKETSKNSTVGVTVLYEEVLEQLKLYLQFAENYNIYSSSSDNNIFIYYKEQLYILVFGAHSLWGRTTPQCP